MKRTELSSRIWRTVVFSGAMLGASTAGADQAPPPQKVEAPLPVTTESVTRELAINTTVLVAALDELVRAHQGTPDPCGAPLDVGVAARRVDEYRNLRKTIEARLAKLPKAPPPAANIAKQHKAVADLDAKLLLAHDGYAKARTDAEKTAAVTKLAALLKDRAAADGKLREAMKRPRTDDKRPVGRGFVLS